MRALYDLPAPAKLNLFLHIVGRRADGYHLLQSVFVPLDLHDLISLEPRLDGAISREDLCGHGTGAFLPDDDLCVRAARLLKAHTGVHLGVHIGLLKRIPAEAGMGGGSSDAATTLLGLNRLWNTGLSRTELAVLGRQLGADVPFFVGGATAWVEGTGEVIHPISLPPQRYGVAKPPVGLSTAAVFAHPLLQRNTPKADRLGVMQRWQNTAPFGQNDLEPAARALCPDVDWGLRHLAQAGLHGRMTGSGSAMFAPLGGQDSMPTFPAEWFVTECRSLATHPLADWAS